jgi:hypothetical protein
MDLVHLCSPGPAGSPPALTARIMELPVAGSYHTELAAYTALRTGDERLALGMRLALGASTAAVRVVPVALRGVSDARLVELASRRKRIGRWDRGVDVASASARAAEPRPASRAGINVLYAGRLDEGEGRRPARPTRSSRLARARPGGCTSS